MVFLLLTQLCLSQENHKVKISKSLTLYKAVQDKTYDYFFRVDTVKDKKVVIYEVLNKRRLETKFDSITFNQFFIVGYLKQKITVYNYTLKKFKLPGLKAVKFERYSPVINIIQNNELKTINLNGTEYKTGDVRYDMYYDEMPGNYVSLKISQKEGQFFIYSDYLYDLLNKAKFSSWETEFKMYNADNVIETGYSGDYHKINIYTPGLRSIKYPFLISTKLKNGKYNLNTIDYLISEKPSLEVEKENAELPKNLDELTTQNGFYKIKKNGLVTYYPLIKVTRWV